MDSIINCIKTNCKPYIEILKKCEKGRLLVRGSKHQKDSIKEYKKNVEVRKPLNMPIEIHNTLNLKFEAEFGWKIRNGIFCFGFNILNSNPIDLGYGENHMFFPKGEFDFVYEQNAFDLYDYLSINELSIEENINSLKFHSTDLSSAMKSGENENLFSNEISIKAESYYLINMKLKDEIINHIWS
jgi:hypothetical protein